ncbi:GNAT family N-acetyltransferase [Paracoccus sp. DMF-8]|uniref:GNAT family N-acetyltransferase n=1 Tax=Paracoccus sp. DMF-8 TaxID=3019445 RepID=UPI0023E46E40|nr:GNAT family N-acetyltransferase [Paracoccus sp. DMF-8]MDF3607786.1 GNAT family N-acetyltransferase [Paracoccus sp. DMF-8]
MTPTPSPRAPAPKDLAQIHARCFPAHPRAWSAGEIAALTDRRGSFLLTRPAGFLIGRVIADEAELLTLAVAPEARRQGRGRQLLHEFQAKAAAMGAAEGFLEVASDNPAALALYLSQGWQRAGLRRNYYAPGVDALILHHRFTASHEIG